MINLFALYYADVGLIIPFVYPQVTKHFTAIAKKRAFCISKLQILPYRD